MIELVIESLAYGGDAIGRLPDGRVAFVTGGCPGDVVTAEVTEEHDRFVRANVSEVITPSASRVTPPCPYFPVCGGCSWQHVSYETQMVEKRRSVVEALKRIGGIDTAESLVAPTVASQREYGYRNKVELVADPTASRVTLGFHRHASDQVVPVEACLMLPKRLQRAPKALSGALRYLSGEADLGLTRVGLRVAANTKDVEVALWTSPGPFPRAHAAKLLGQALPTTSVVRVITKGPAKQRKVVGVEALSGRGHWRERMGGTSYAVSAPSFFQVNTPTAERLVSFVLDAIGADGSDRVLDLYAGAGTFTLPLAAAAGEVIAVESAGSAVRDLRRNLESNELWAEVVGGDAAREIAAFGHFDAVVVDPPRSGLDAAIVDAVATVRPRCVVYVSCGPATLARDAKRFAVAGYSLDTLTPVDLFPQTYHVESVARFVPTT